MPWLGLPRPGPWRGSWAALDKHAYCLLVSWVNRTAALGQVALTGKNQLGAPVVLPAGARRPIAILLLSTWPAQLGFLDSAGALWPLAGTVATTVCSLALSVLPCAASLSHLEENRTALCLWGINAGAGTPAP